MIKANELRIGNLIYQGEYGILPITAYELYQYYLLNLNDGHLLTVASYYKDWKPIPLTEEWLLKFGFEIKINDYFLSWNFPLISGGIKIETERWFVMMDNIIISRCKYVHQLQNLYFALTGEELTIKQDAEKA